MASMFITVSFIKNASNANKYTAGTAVYRAGDDEFNWLLDDSTV
ncbi:21887_t:CDS:2 [Gigaspora margarita]|uniref:21887_t:CDS:1 n=1 Tax=Gigaspora margarita TaxID=4874 RepID=A0ABN7UH73_GIGMA|nr:21887_t:CDS:2 [Gigaspora margarita]